MKYRTPIAIGMCIFALLAASSLPQEAGNPVPEPNVSRTDGRVVSMDGKPVADFFAGLPRTVPVPHRSSCSTPSAMSAFLQKIGLDTVAYAQGGCYSGYFRCFYYEYACDAPGCGSCFAATDGSAPYGGAQVGNGCCNDDIVGSCGG